MRRDRLLPQILHVWNAVREYIVVGRTYGLACHPVEQSRSNDANEWAFSPRPIVAEWARSEAGNASDDEKCTVIQKVSHSNINTGIDVLLIYKYSLNDVLDCVLGDERLCAITLPARTALNERLDDRFPQDALLRMSIGLSLPTKNDHGIGVRRSLGWDETGYKCQDE